MDIYFKKTKFILFLINLKNIFLTLSAYHGHLLSTMEVSPYKFNQSENIDVKKPDHVHIVSIKYTLT
jgi:4-aminobutyrate aminotransferase-like enzyme